MRNIWLVARHEYRRMVVRRGFILVTIAIPVGLAALIGLAVLVELASMDTSPVGYVDQAGLLDANIYEAEPWAAEPSADEDRFEILPFENEESALAALESEQIQAFFVLPPEYPQTLKTDLYYLQKSPGDAVWSAFGDFVRLNLVADLPPEVQSRLIEGPKITVHDVSSNRTFSEDTFINVIMPFAASFFFLVATMSAAGYMLRVVADEKENRTMELMMTSMTPGQLIGGKSIGLLAAALTQLAIYLAAIVVALSVAANYVEVLQRATVPWGYLAVMTLFFFPAYALMAAVMVAIGSAVTEVEQGQQVAGMLSLVFMMPLFLLPLLFADPNQTIVVLLTLFPPTAFMTVSLRWGLGTIPAWQLGLSWLLLVIATLAIIRASARIFRAGMLRYGQPLSLKGALAAVTGR